MSKVADETRLDTLKRECPLVEVTSEVARGHWTIRGIYNGEVFLSARAVHIGNAVASFRESYSKAVHSGLVRKK